MDHKNTTLAIAAIVAAAALTGVVFAIPQQVMAGGYGHRHNNNHNSNSIKVDQQINQLNACNGTSSTAEPRMAASTDNSGSSSSTLCVNTADNSADIHK